jgi:NCS1 family nucleobase:cation symporter-1
MINDERKEYLTSDPIDISSGSSEDGTPSLWRRIKANAALHVSDSRMAPGTRWSNKGVYQLKQCATPIDHLSDLDPVEPEFQTWRTYNCKSCFLC